MNIETFLSNKSAVFQTQFLKITHELSVIQRRARLFGDTETLRYERNVLIYDINKLCIDELGISFNELNYTYNWNI